MGRIYSDITKLVGHTPLVRVNRMTASGGGEVLLKLEAYNPYASVKDRIGLSMIEDAERRGLLNKESVIVEATSGNTGISLAFVAAVKGYKIILTMPDTMTIERRNLLKAFGAELELTPGDKGMKGAMERADAIAADLPNAWKPEQFENPANPQIHVETTGPEIWADTDGAVDVFVAGVGTGGTINGVGQFLKGKKKTVHIVAVEPIDSPVLSGGDPGPHKIQGMGAGFIPKTYNADVVDEVMQVTNENAIKTSRQLTREEGVFAGISAGAIVWSALEVAKRPQFAGKNIVAIVPDFGERYLSNPVYSEL